MQSAVLPVLPPSVVAVVAAWGAGVPVVVVVLLQPPSASNAVTKTAIAASGKVREPHRFPEFAMRQVCPPHR